MSQNNGSSPTPAWSNPTPAGLVALAIACFCFFALLSGKVTANAIPLLGCWLIGGFVVQLIVGLLDLKSGNMTGGNTFLFFSAFFMLTGGIEMLIKFKMATEGIPLDARIDGWAWLVLAVSIILWTPAFLKTPLPLALAVIFVDIAAPFIALIDLGVLSKDLSFIPAYALLAAGLCGIYLAAAMVVNNAFGRTIYPIPGPPIK